MSGYVMIRTNLFRLGHKPMTMQLHRQDEEIRTPLNPINDHLYE